MNTYILAIDQGTTSTRAVIFSSVGELVSQHQIEFKQYFPHDGWVEHDPEEIWQSVIICCQLALSKASLIASQIAAIGISNQRETTVLWNRRTGQTIYPAIVWQDRRTAELCQQLSNLSIAAKVQQKTGLLLDPYFSATKIKWLLENVSQAKQSAAQGELAFGTIDTFLLWRLTNGKSHATDATNAARTLLFNIHTQQWDPELLALFEIPPSLLPTVLDNNAHFGDLETSILGHPIPVLGMIGDQQAATLGQACFKPGMVKSTYGTGCFVMLNTGKQCITSQHQLLSTIAWRLNGTVTYALEGSIFVAGAAVQWLRDALHLVHQAQETQALAAAIPDTDGVYLVPAFTGLGAPYWDPKARGALVGLTRNTGIPQIVRAALEAVCYQTRDLIAALELDYAEEIINLRVDGGMVINDWLLQFLADMLNIPVERPKIYETTSLGAAYLAGFGAGIYTSLEEISNHWQGDRIFLPNMEAKRRADLYLGWQNAVKRILVV